MIGQKFISIFEEIPIKERQGFLKHLKGSNVKRKKISIEIARNTVSILDDNGGSSRSKSILMLSKKYGKVQLRNIYSNLSTELANYLCILYLQQNPGFRKMVVLKSGEQLQLSNVIGLLDQKNAIKNEVAIHTGNDLVQYEINKISSQQYDNEDVDYLTSQFQKVDRYARYEKIKLLISIFFKHDLESTEVSEELKAEARFILENKEAERSDLLLSGLEFSLDLEISNNANSFDCLITLLQKIDSSEYQEEVAVILLTCFNFCVRCINQGQEEYGIPIRDLIIQRMKIPEVPISEAELRNFILCLCRYGDSITAKFWLDERINDISHFLRDDVRNLCIATIKSYDRELLKAIVYLSKVKYSNPFYYLQSKVQLVRIYFELQEYEACKAILENIRLHSLRGGVLPVNSKQSLKTLIKVTRKLIKIAETPTRSQVKSMVIKLMDEVESATELVNKKWFLIQLEKLST